MLKEGAAGRESEGVSGVFMEVVYQSCQQTFIGGSRLNDLTESRLSGLLSNTFMGNKNGGFDEPSQPQLADHVYQILQSLAARKGDGGKCSRFPSFQ